MKISYHRLYVLLVISLVSLLAVALWYFNYSVADGWRTVANGLLINFITTPLILLFLYLVCGKKLLGLDEREAGVTKSPGTEEFSSQVVTLIANETTQIDNSLEAIGRDVRSLLQRNPHSTWDDYHSILVNLRGQWLEYIPLLEPDGHEYSIAKFDLDADGRHSFSGKNYHVSGTFAYSWTTVKLLPPIRLDNDTLCLYYIYRREGNPAYADQHGFGKLIARRTGSANDEYDFTEGFFFNEALKQGGHHPMQLRRLKNVASVVNVKESEIESDPTTVQRFFAVVRSKNFF